MFTPEKIAKMRACLSLLPEPGNEVVGECLDEIERLQKELDAIATRKMGYHKYYITRVLPMIYKRSDEFRSTIYAWGEAAWKAAILYHPEITTTGCIACGGKLSWDGETCAKCGNTWSDGTE